MEELTANDDLCEIHHTHPDKLEHCAVHKLDDATSQELADIFKILGDKTRIKLLSLLASETELCVCDIAESLQMGQSAISHQLRVLRAARDLLPADLDVKKRDVDLIGFYEFKCFSSGRRRQDLTARRDFLQRACQVVESGPFVVNCQKYHNNTRPEVLFLY